MGPPSVLRVKQPSWSWALKVSGCLGAKNPLATGRRPGERSRVGQGLGGELADGSLADGAR